MVFFKRIFFIVLPPFIGFAPFIGLPPVLGSLSFVLKEKNLAKNDIITLSSCLREGLLFWLQILPRKSDFVMIKVHRSKGKTIFLVFLTKGRQFQKFKKCTSVSNLFLENIKITLRVVFNLPWFSSFFSLV